MTGSENKTPETFDWLFTPKWLHELMTARASPPKPHASNISDPNTIHPPQTTFDILKDGRRRRIKRQGKMFGGRLLSDIRL